MADRIAEYLRRLELELVERVGKERAATIVSEVESHLRESAEAFQALGEPEDLADRLAVEGFGDVRGSIRALSAQPSRLRSSIAVIGFAGFFLALILSAWLTKYSFWGWVSAFALVAAIGGAFFVRHWGRALWGNITVLVAAMAVLPLFFGGSWNTYRGSPVVQRLEADQQKWLVDGAPIQRKLWELEKMQSWRASANTPEDIRASEHAVYKLELALEATRDVQTSSYFERFKFVGFYVAVFAGGISGCFWVAFGVGRLLRLSGTGLARLAQGRLARG